MTLGHYDTGALWNRDIMELGHYGIGTLWNWDMMKLGHYDNDRCDTRTL